jgi:hypothetical protein
MMRARLSFLVWLFFGCAALAFNPAGSLIDDLNDEIDSRLAHAKPADIAMFTRADDESGIYIRNPTVWTGNIDLTGIAVHSLRHHGSSQAGVLITPADIVVADHFRLNLGDLCTFVDNSNVAYHATVIAMAHVTGDITVEHLAWIRKAPTTLKVLPILAPDYRLYSPDHNLSPFPVVCTNQFRQVFVQESAPPLGNAIRRFPFINGMFFHFPARSPNRVPFTKTVIVGDSSQPVMAIIHGVAVLITCNTTAVWGLSYPDHFEAINHALAVMGSRHRASVIDLSSFPSY